MIGLDTNVLVRFFTEDDPIQFKRARSFIERRLSAEEPGYVNLVVLAELAWTLGRAYGYGKDEIASAINALLDSTEISVEREETVAAAAGLARAANLEFVDALVAVMNWDAGCRETVTFDTRFARSKAATLLDQ